MFIFKSKKLVYVSLSLVSTTLLLFVFTVVEPPENNLLIVFIPLLSVWVLVFSVVHLLIDVLTQSKFRLGNALSASIASSTVLLFMFSALGDVSVFDVGLLMSLTAVGVFYVRRTWPK